MKRTEYTAVSFVAPVSLQRGAVRSVSSIDFDIELLDGRMLELTDKGTENGHNSVRMGRCKGEKAHIPVSNMAFGLVKKAAEQ